MHSPFLSPRSSLVCVTSSQAAAQQEAAARAPEQGAAVPAAGGDAGDSDASDNDDNTGENASGTGSANDSGSSAPDAEEGRPGTRGLSSPSSSDQHEVVEESGHDKNAVGTARESADADVVEVGIDMDTVMSHVIAAALQRAAGTEEGHVAPPLPNRPGFDAAPWLSLLQRAIAQLGEPNGPPHLSGSDLAMILRALTHFDGAGADTAPSVASPDAQPDQRHEEKEEGHEGEEKKSQ